MLFFELFLISFLLIDWEPTLLIFLLLTTEFMFPLVAFCGGFGGFFWTEGVRLLVFGLITSLVGYVFWGDLSNS